MKVNKKVCSIQYDVKITLSDEEKEILKKSLEILKVVNEALDENFSDRNVSSLSIGKDVNDIVLEIDKYTDYICK